jgi:hypothetical protein
MNKLFIASLGLLLVSNSFSAIITYTQRDVWESLLTEETVIDFEGIINSGVTTYPGNPQHIGFSSTKTIHLVDETFIDADQSLTLGTGDVILGYNSGLGITAFNFSGNAIGMDLRGYLEPISTFELTLSSGEIASTTVNNPQGGFIGIVSDDLITSVRVATSTVVSENIIMDNFSFGTAAAVPEPGIFSLMACSLIFIPYIIRKKIK